MSFIITGAALFRCTLPQLYVLERSVRQDLTNSAPGSAAWHEAVRNLEAIRCAIAARRQAPKPPGF